MDIDITYICYKITNTVNGKLYIGQTSRPLEDRWKQHVGYATWNTSTDRNAKALHKAMRKYGVDAFVIEPLETANTAQQVALLEVNYIKDLNTHTSGRRGYNMTSGGDGTIGYVFTAEDRYKMSLAQRGKKRGPRSEEVKLKISQAHKRSGHGPSNLCNKRRSETGAGVPRPDSVKRQIQATLKGRPRPPEVIEKIRATKRRQGEQKSTST